MRIFVVAALTFSVLSSYAHAQSSDQAAQQACGNDVFALCQAAVPDRGRIEACLRRNFARVSKRCRVFMTGYGKHQRSKTHRSRTDREYGTDRPPPIDHRGGLDGSADRTD
jgi:hypothetical protein